MTTNFFKQDYFSLLTNEELVDTFNKEVWNTGWTSSRFEYLSLLHSEFIKRRFDYSSIWDEKSLSFKYKIKLLDKKVFLQNIIN